MFNGFDECLLYYHTNELKLKNPSLTVYNINQLIEEKLELKTLLYKNFAPFAQIAPVPGTQNYYSRLYTQLYYSDLSYEDIMLNGQKKLLDENNLNEFDTSVEFEKFIKDVDKEISKNMNKPNFDEIWDKI